MDGKRQWRNRLGAECPQRLLTGKFLLTYWEKRGKEKRERGENGEEMKENFKREGGKLEMEVEKLWKIKEVRTFFFFFFFFFAFHFWKRQKFGSLFWIYQNGNFSTGKEHFTPGKKIRKNDFAPSEKYACYAPGKLIILCIPPSPARITLLVSGCHDLWNFNIWNMSHTFSCFDLHLCWANLARDRTVRLMTWCQKLSENFLLGR